MAQVGKRALQFSERILSAVASGDINDPEQHPPADLLELYNKHAEQFGMAPLKRFNNADHRVARCTQLAEAIKLASEQQRQPAERGAAVATSWADPAVRAARSARYRVLDPHGQEHSSVLKAFVALGLPVKKHAASRRTLATKGSVDVDGIVLKRVEPSAS